MRKFFVIAIALAVLAGGALWWRAGDPGAPSAPDRIAAARASGKPVLVEFGAGSCSACREMKGVLADLSDSHGDRMVILDIEFATPEGRQVLRTYGMQAIPTQLFFAADGREIFRHMGAMPAKDILEILDLADG